ncbi:MAG: putative DNA binding domain-containing protein [Bacteroidetes bacterium]|nr:putative DNA binding domain-containing protein [Bacteroidota bacterium]
MISREQLINFISNPEDDRIEKTESTTDSQKFGEAICSFANDLPNHNKPGYLIIGVKKDNLLNGLMVTEPLLQLLMDFRNDGRIVPPPAITVARFILPDGDVAVVEVQPSTLPPVKFKHQIYIRIGPRRGVANEQEERILNEKRSTNARTYDAFPCLGSTMNDLSMEIFRTVYLPNAIDGETLKANNRESVNQLASLQFYDIKHNCPTVAGILMFGINPMHFLPGAYIQYIRFKGTSVTDEFDLEKKFSGDLTTQMKVLDEFINAQIIKTKAVRKNKSIQEEYFNNYPAWAIREFLFNAIIHRDYQSNSFVKFYEFENCIEITNPGGLYGLVTPENFPRVNDYRNPALAEAVKNLGYVNRFNIGILRAQEELKKNGNNPPDLIINDRYTFSVKIFARIS